MQIHACMPPSNLGAVCRVGDTYPTQHLDVSVRAYIYRWQPSRKPSACGIPNVRPAQHAAPLYARPVTACSPCPLAAAAGCTKSGQPSQEANLLFG